MLETAKVMIYEGDTNNIDSLITLLSSLSHVHNVLNMEECFVSRIIVKTTNIIAPSFQEFLF